MSKLTDTLFGGVASSMPKVKEILFGKKDKIKKASTLSPEQDQLLKLIHEGLTSGEGAFGDLFGAFDEESFNKGVTQPELKNFRENILPELQEKFISKNQVLGSGLQRAQTKAGVDLQSKLAELMYQAKQDKGKMQLAGLQTGLGTKPFENIYKQGSTGAIPGAIQGLISGGAKAAGASIAG
jgi:hypothetical protein